jgi:hypothetical protein
MPNDFPLEIGYEGLATIAGFKCLQVVGAKTLQESCAILAR